jgi:16S rRNA (adenine1518-N6/adenine1519-N6)-dimethyltransferase
MTGPLTQHRARKRFGQNFLIDRQVIGQILDAINCQPRDHIVEIGPGLGALTEGLIHSAARLTVVEIDRDLAADLRHRYGQRPHFQLHQADALTLDFSTLGQGEALRIVGNLPYNISTPLLFHLLDYRPAISDMCFMLQKEVVERLAAAPGSKNYGRLSIMMQYHCQVRSVLTVPPQAFRPAPKVTSAVVQLQPHANPPWEAVDMRLFSRLVNTCFQQRRKTLRNSLKLLPGGREIDVSEFDLSARPESLTVEDFVTLANLLAQAV